MCRCCSSLWSVSSSSSQRRSKARFTASRCSRRSSAVSRKMQSMSSLRLTEARRSRSARCRFSWVNLAHVSGVEALGRERAGSTGGAVGADACQRLPPTWPFPRRLRPVTSAPQNRPELLPAPAPPRKPRTQRDPASPARSRAAESPVTPRPAPSAHPGCSAIDGGRTPPAGQRPVPTAPTLRSRRLLWRTVWCWACGQGSCSPVHPGTRRPVPGSPALEPRGPGGLAGCGKARVQAGARELRRAPGAAGAGRPPLLEPGGVRVDPHLGALVVVAGAGLVDGIRLHLVRPVHLAGLLVPPVQPGGGQGLCLCGGEHCAGESPSAPSTPPVPRWE